jgi:hypothetical protein
MNARLVRNVAWSTAGVAEMKASSWCDPKVSSRIITLTLNPAVDIACKAPAVRPTHKTRTFEERYDPGGGGINVARVVHVLGGGDALALIMTGG